MSTIKKNYLIINIVLFLLILYGLSIPYTGPIIKKYTPVKNFCSYKSLTKKNCPFCGITTDFKQIYRSKNLSISPKNSISIIIFYVFCLEVTIRPLFIILRKRLPHFIILLDAILHILFFILILCWILYFFIS